MPVFPQVSNVRSPNLHRGCTWHECTNWQI